MNVNFKAGQLVRILSSGQIAKVIAGTLFGYLLVEIEVQPSSLNPKGRERFEVSTTEVEKITSY